MSKTTNKLSGRAIEEARAKDKPYKIADGGGLYIYISTAGGKLWRLNYWHDGKRKTLSFGAYPGVSLFDARERREEAKAVLASGVDPCGMKGARKAKAKVGSALVLQAENLEGAADLLDTAGGLLHEASCLIKRAVILMTKRMGKNHEA
ncbi:MAG: Arm DNA-binding domain-containing protein [Betaproteobacteria bacterium]|nr:Arm DNA-binding domain-containing protein [Betaproteobacteria bacterium]